MSSEPGDYGAPVQERTLKETVRAAIWTELRKVARPDSRFHWNFSDYIADYEGSEEGGQRIRALPGWQQSQLLFITPDNNLEVVRRIALEDGKPFVMSTYGIGRGFLYLTPDRVAPDQRAWAATLDGMDRFAQPITLRELAALGRFDVLVTGASAISTQGIRMGKGHGYFDLEWAMFSQIGCLSAGVRVVAACHDCQVVEMDLYTSDLDTRVDLIVTPTRVIPIPEGQGSRAGRVVWEKLPSNIGELIPPLAELRSWLSDTPLSGSGEHRSEVDR